MLYTRKREGAPIEILDFRSSGLEAREIMTEIVRHLGEGVAWDEIAILYCNNPLSRLFKEALMWARIPYSPVGDVGVYQSAEDTPPALRHDHSSTTTESTVSPVAFECKSWILRSARRSPASTAPTGSLTS